MTRDGGAWRRIRRIAAAGLGAALLTLASGCAAAADTRTVITVWSWEPSMRAVIEDFERANPDIRVELDATSGYTNLNRFIQDGYNLPDVVQLEYYALGQYAVSGQLLDITDRVADYAGQYTPGTWSSVQLNGTVYGLPMDSGPMAFFYNEDVFPPGSSRRSACTSRPTPAMPASSTPWSGWPAAGRFSPPPTARR